MSASPARPRPLVTVVSACLLLLCAGADVQAQDAPNPFSDVPGSNNPYRKRPRADTQRSLEPQPYLPPMQEPDAPPAYTARPPTGEGAYAPPPWQSRPAPAAAYGAPAQPIERARGGVMREELAPIPGAASDPAPAGRGGFSVGAGVGGMALPPDIWRGLDMARLEALLGRLEIPPHSPALHALWRRVMTTEATAPSGAASPEAFDALRFEALLRSGLVREVADALARRPETLRDPAMAMMLARSELALGHRDKACAIARGLSRDGAGAAKAVRGEVALFNGFCAAAGGNKAGAGLAADMAREAGVDVPGLALLDAVASGGKPRLAAHAAVSLIEFKLLELAGGLDRAKVVGQAKPALLAALASDAATEPTLRVAAAEAAARLNAVTPQALADVYRATPQNRGDAASTRAELFRTAESEANPQRKARLIRGFLDEARRSGLYLPALVMVAKASQAVAAVPEIGWFAETAVEIALASDDFAAARRWITFGQALDQPGGVESRIGGWLALADIADPALGRDRGQSLTIIEELALKGRFKPELLHRLATVLDALDYQVPIPLWEAASRTPQPAGGHLPATGVLTELQDASKKKEIGRTVLLAMDALGPDGAEGAHMIALGDSIRALHRAGLDADARRLGFEALMAQWPRAATN